MKNMIIIGLALSLLSCGENQKTEQSNTENNPATEQIAKTIEETTKETDINGKWEITKVSGVTGKNLPVRQKQSGNGN